MSICVEYFVLCFFKQKTAYEMRISDWSSDVCSSDLTGGRFVKYLGVLLLCVMFRKELNADYASLCTDPNGYEFVYEQILCNLITDSPGLQNGKYRLLREVVQPDTSASAAFLHGHEIGRASCRERVCQYV